MSRKPFPIVGHLPKKRTSAEDNDDEQTNEDSDGVFQQENKAKRARLDSFSDTTLQDLPNELLECILIKAVAMEVKDLKLIRSVWKDKVDLAISRLKSVSSHWTSILSTDVFRNEVHKLLDGTAQETIRLEILHESSTPSVVHVVTSLKDEIFMLERRNQSFLIKVYNRDNMAEMKDVIPLKTAAQCMAACNVSNCIYVGLRNGGSLSVMRISKDGDQFNISPWINDHKLPIYKIYLSANGNLVILSLPVPNETVRNVVSVYNANGSLQREVRLPPDIDVFSCRKAFQKSNGNLVVAYVSRRNDHTNLVELDASGSVMRQYESSVAYYSRVNFADIYDRILITGQSQGKMELLDSEFNLIGIYSFQQDEGKNPFVFDVHYASERNEIVRTLVNCSQRTSAITIFRFTED